MRNKGIFTPKNPQKYKGDCTNIVYRSSWELKLMMYLDDHPDILQWASEEIAIPYVSPIDGKVHRYFPDFWIKKKNTQGNISITVVEVKPAAQMIPPTVQKARTKSYINEVVTWGINQAKWKAAEKYCAARKWEFLKMNEKQLGIKV